MNKIPFQDLKNHLQKQIVMKQDESNRWLPVILTNATEEEVYYKTMDYNTKYGYASINDCDRIKISFYENN